MNNAVVQTTSSHETSSLGQSRRESDERSALYRAWIAPKLRKRRSLNVSQRLIQAADRLTEIAPRRLLEIGCGHGILLSEVSRRLPDSTLIGLDRSKSMVRAARRRNSAALAEGRVEIHETTLEAYIHQGATVDAIATVNFGPLGAPEETGRSIWPAAQCLRRSGIWIDIFDSPIAGNVERHLIHALRIFDEAGLSPVIHSLNSQRVEIHARVLERPSLGLP